MNWFQSSAILGSAVSTLSRCYTAPEKLSNAMSIPGIQQHLGRVAGMSLSVPFDPRDIANQIRQNILGNVQEGQFTHLHQLDSVVSLFPRMKKVRRDFGHPRATK